MEQKLANPAVLGLTGFGLTTMLLNLHNINVIKGPESPILALGIFVGGLAQIIAGLLEYRKGNTFASTAFCIFGGFWLSYVFIVLGELKWGLPVTNDSIGWFLVMFGLFTAFMTIGAVRINGVLAFVFSTLTVLFALLAICEFAEITPEDGGLMLISGILGLICGFSALYLAMAQNINEIYGKTVLPVFPLDE